MNQPTSSQPSQSDADLIAEVLEQTQEAVAATPNEPSAELPASNVDIQALQSELEQTREQAAAHWDKAVRIQAEMENLKKRVQKDLDDERKYGLSKFAKELLTVVDSLELGLQATTGDNPELARLREGSELTLKQFEAVFAKFNIEAVNPLGQPFNPELHQAMAMQPTSGAEPNTVLNVFQKGYVINGRLLRPAMVVVAKAEDKPADSIKIDEQA